MLFVEDLAEAVHNFQVVLVVAESKGFEIMRHTLTHKETKHCSTYWWCLRKVGWGLGLIGNKKP
jgi:hypothetical protein